MANEYPSGVFTSCLGEEKTLLSLPGADDAYGIVLLQLAGLPHDDALERFDSLGALLAAHPEANFTNYSRRWFATPPTLTVDKPNNRAHFAGERLQYTAMGGATNNELGKLLWVYRAASNAADSAIRPVVHYRCVMTTDGTNREISVNAEGSLILRNQRT